MSGDLSDPLPVQPLAAVSGVYLLTLGGEVVYVGQAEDVVWRVSQHYRDRDKVFDGSSYHPVPLGRLDEVETALTRRYAPRYNARPNGVGNHAGTALAMARDVDTAVGFLAATDEDGIGGRDLYTRVTRRTGSGTPKGRFHRAMDADPRVRYIPAEGVYRLISAAV